MQFESETLETTPSSSITRTSRKSPFSFAYSTNPSERHPERNEDTLVVDQRRGLAAVFDGVGGSAAGEIASQLAATVAKDGWKRLLQSQEAGAAATFGPYRDLDASAVLQQLIAEAHKQIRSDGEQRSTNNTGQDKSRSWLDDQATTVALAVIVQEAESNTYTLVYAHVGDSRIYLLRPQETLKRLTEDDSILTELVKNHELSVDQAQHIDQAVDEDDLSDIELACFQQRNGITQALGDSQSLQIHVASTQLHPGDQVLFSTDGIHDNLTDREIEAILRKGKYITAARRLVQYALQRSQEDRTSLRAKADDMSAVVVTYRF